ncbi:MAG: MmcB family DNA repair protein [Rhizobiaceae bacterium]|nr:MmcB family DNA repair protein [Rhizobiaceae bacterium]
MPIVTYRDSNPMVDGRQSDKALMIQCGVMRHFLLNDVALLPELVLANGRRADLVGIDKKGQIIIIEIKSSIEDFRIDQKWPQYRDFCDRFYFASHARVPAEIFPDDEGFIVADGYGAEIIREANEHKLAPASRKALTLRFARASAGRLERVIRFTQSAGVDTPDDLADIAGE